MDLDGFPAPLRRPACVNSLGRFPVRFPALACWREALTGGRLPEGIEWPPRKVRERLDEAMAVLALPGFCLRYPAMVDELLVSLLWHLDRIVDYREERGEDDAIALAVQRFAEDWRLSLREVQALVDVFDDLGGLLKDSRWSDVRGLLKSQGWQELVRIRRMLEGMPELAGLIRRLGRARQTEDIDPQARPRAPVVEKRTRRGWRVQELEIPDMPGETVGVERSGRVSRMLPSDAALLGHPRLRRLWFARLAERSLVTYRDRATLRELTPIEDEAWLPDDRPDPQRRLEMGPILVCVDTSGSMQGAAERVAKAAVLEAMRAAHAQGRRCYVYAFSGPEDIAEHELPLNAAGAGALLQFMASSFHSGTDIQGPIERALERIEQAEWRLADLLIASDGEFGLPPPSAQRLKQTKTTAGLFVQGILIGDRETIGMREICDDVFWVSDWRRYGDHPHDGSSPVHTKDLTAIYFPNALR